MRVSVVIPVKDDPRVRNCVMSVLACADEVEALEVIVVDDGSLEMLAGLPDEVVVLELPHSGVYAARNRGVEASNGDVILFTDADCVVEKGWLKAAVAAIEGGADLVQGYSGSVDGDLAGRLTQSRYEEPLRRARPGSGTETDTRNLAVRREVFERMRFNEKYRRVCDTEFGLLAEVAGFRVVYEPAMRLSHDHDDDLRLFAAKQVCHGWGAQRLVEEHPEVRWHGGFMLPLSRAVAKLRPVPGVRRIGLGLARLMIGAAGLVARVGPVLPFRLVAAVMLVVDKAAGLAGHLLYVGGTKEPSPSGLLGRRLPRD